MPILCTVRIPHPLERVQQVEEAHPEVMQVIGAAAQKYMTSHRRFAADGEVLDLDEYVRREDYDAFIGEAHEAIRRYGELLGGSAQDTVYDATG